MSGARGSGQAARGWYPISDQLDAYWDGSRWTSQTRERARSGATPPSVHQHPVDGGLVPAAVVTGLIAGALLLLALAPLPYGFYTFLRLAVTAAAVILIVLASRSRQVGWIVFGVIAALLFNPLIPVTATREFWAPIDFVGAVLFIVAGFCIRPVRA